MNCANRFVLLLLMLTLAVRAIGEESSSSVEMGSFVTLKQGDGSEFRAFVAGPADGKAAVLIVHDYFGISDATKESVKHLGALGYRSVAVDLYGGKSATSHGEAVKLMQSLKRKATDKILQADSIIYNNLAGSWRPLDLAWADRNRSVQI